MAGDPKTRFLNGRRANPAAKRRERTGRASNGPKVAEVDREGARMDRKWRERNDEGAKHGG
eukprot:5142945-Pyramimonas_sp.AAC.1